MIRPAWWLVAFATAVVLWQESGENLGLFCYRIGWGALECVRSRPLSPIPVSARTELSCWNPSVTSSTRSTT